MFERILCSFLFGPLVQSVCVCMNRCVYIYIYIHVPLQCQRGFCPIPGKETKILLTRVWLLILTTNIHKLYETVKHIISIIIKLAFNARAAKNLWNYLTMLYRVWLIRCLPLRLQVLSAPCISRQELAASIQVLHYHNLAIQSAGRS